MLGQQGLLFVQLLYRLYKKVLQQLTRYCMNMFLLHTACIQYTVPKSASDTLKHACWTTVPSHIFYDSISITHDMTTTCSSV